MKLKNNFNLHLPTVQYGNTDVGNALEMDTENANDMKLLGLDGPATSGDDVKKAMKALSQLNMEETFAQKEFLEANYDKNDFKINV